MATKLIKPIKRELLSTEQNGKHRGKPIIVELMPGDEISFRIKGTKKSQSVYLGHCYRLAQIFTIERNYNEAMALYKKGGRKRKPKRPAMPFSKMYFDAIKK